jgi:hypothetical protein
MFCIHFLFTIIPFDFFFPCFIFAPNFRCRAIPVVTSETPIINLEGDRVTTMENIQNNATTVATSSETIAASESVNAAENAASFNSNPEKMEKSNEEVAKTTRVAIIDGVERVITVAHTKYSMELPKDKKSLCKKLDPSKLLSVIYHLAKPELFWQEGIDLYDENGDIIIEGTPDVLVHVQTSEDYWRVGLEERLERVEIVDFSSIQEYAQTVGSTNLYSRGMTDTEKVGVAALATGNKAYMAVYEFAKENKMSLTTARMYLDVSMDKTQILEMSTGSVPENAPKLGRTKKQAAELLKQAEKTFGKNARKRYIIRPLNTLEHQKEYSREMIMTAVKSITKEQATKVEIANTDERESLVSSILTKLLKTGTREDSREKAAA